MSRLDNILEYKQNNPGVDPNLYEVVDITRYMVDKLNKEAPYHGIYTQPDLYLKDSNGEPSQLVGEIEKYEEIYKINMQALLNNDLGITKDSALYRFMSDIKGDFNTSSMPPKYAEKLVGVALYIQQQKRAVERGEQDKVVYDNKSEVEFLKEMLTPEYKRMLNSGKLKDESRPEFEVYDEVFSAYINSIEKGEHQYNLMSADYIRISDIKKMEREKETSFLDNLKKQVNTEPIINGKRDLNQENIIKGNSIEDNII